MKKSIFFILISFSVQVYGAGIEPSVNYEPYVMKVEGIEASLMVEMSKIFFNIYADLSLKKKLTEVSDFFKCFFFARLKINDFIDLLYEYKDEDNFFQWLIANVNDEYKNVLTHFYVYGLGSDFVYTEKPYDYCDDKSKIFKEIIQQIGSSKNYIKFFIPYSSMHACIFALKRDTDPDSGYDCPDSLPFIQWIDNYRLTIAPMIKEVCSFFNEECNHKNFLKLYQDIEQQNDVYKADLIKNALMQQNLPVILMVLMSKYIIENGEELKPRQGKDWNSEECLDYSELEESKSWFFDNHPVTGQTILNSFTTHDQQKLLARCVIDGCRSFVIRFKESMDSRDINKAESMLIMLNEQYDNLNIIYNAELLCDIVLLEANNIALGLLKGKFDFSTCKVQDPNKCTLEQVINFYLSNKKMWPILSRGRFLHKAVKYKKTELVKQLISIGVNLHQVDKNKKIPLLYSLDHDEIFEILLEAEVAGKDFSYIEKYFELREKRAILLPNGYTQYQEYNVIDSFIRDNPEKNIIKLFTRGLLKPTKEWRKFAEKNNKIYLLRKLTESIPCTNSEKLKAKSAKHLLDNNIRSESDLQRYYMREKASLEKTLVLPCKRFALIQNKEIIKLLNTFKASLNNTYSRYCIKQISKPDPLELTRKEMKVVTTFYE